MTLTTTHLTHALAVGPALGLAVAYHRTVVRMVLNMALAVLTVASGGAIMFAWVSFLNWCL